MLDVFNTSAFDMVSLTTALNKAPFLPKRIGQMNLFSGKGITTRTAVVEERHGRLSLIPSKARGTHENVWHTADRQAKNFSVPYLQLDGEVKASDVQGIRAFGSESMLETISGKVNEILMEIRNSYEATWEFHRVKTLQGILLDGDGSTELFNWFTEFGITETVIQLDLTATDVNAVKTNALTAIRAVEDALGGDTYTQLHAICGNTFFDNLIKNAGVKEAYDRYQESSFFRGTQRGPNGVGGGFPFADIMWENYRGSVGGQLFVPADEARIFPVGVSDLFQTFYSPPDWVETVNTMGRPFYAKQERKKWDEGIDIHTQSNPLHICTRPACLIKMQHVPAASSSSG